MQYFSTKLQFLVLVNDFKIVRVMTSCNFTAISASTLQYFFNSEKNLHTEFA